jgi:hypothetical protein
MWFTKPRGQVGASSIPPQRSTHSPAPPPYVPKLSEYEFIIKVMEEEEKLGCLEGRLVPNVDLDDVALQLRF